MGRMGCDIWGKGVLGVKKTFSLRAAALSAATELRSASAAGAALLSAAAAAVSASEAGMRKAEFKRSTYPASCADPPLSTLAISSSKTSMVSRSGASAAPPALAGSVAAVLRRPHEPMQTARRDRPLGRISPVTAGTSRRRRSIRGMLRLGIWL